MKNLGFTVMMLFAAVVMHSQSTSVAVNQARLARNKQLDQQVSKVDSTVAGVGIAIARNRDTIRQTPIPIPNVFENTNVGIAKKSSGKRPKK